MTIRLTFREYIEQFQEVDEEQLRWGSSDELDITHQFDARIAQGWQREIFLREGIFLKIYDAQYRDCLLVDNPEQNVDVVRCSFGLSGNEHKLISFKPDVIAIPLSAGNYYIRGSGLLPHDIDHKDVRPRSLLAINISPKILTSFAASPARELPQNLQHLIKSPSQEVYLRSGCTTAMMSEVLQQILCCPYHGLVKRAYLESKVIELMALVLDHEATIQRGEVKRGSLKPEQLERVYYAREILLRDLCNPPSLGELAQQVGLNDFLLKQGFRQAFGTTVFRELRSHRLEQAKQLLAEQGTTVAAVAQQVGYADITAFARAFKHKFGVNPKEYQKACR